MLVAGSDVDNDNFIRDAGDACGAYQTLNDEKPIELTENANLSLDISFDRGRFLAARSALNRVAPFLRAIATRTPPKRWSRLPRFSG